MGAQKIRPAGRECQWEAPLAYPYNSSMSFSSHAACAFAIAIGALLAHAQELAPVAGAGVIVTTQDLPTAMLWMPYRSRLQASGGIQPYHWRLFSGSLPPGLMLAEDGELSGTPLEPGQFDFILQVTDSDSPPSQVRKKFTLYMEPPLTVEWSHTARVNGQRIDGSFKVSNRTGRDFDLTVIVLAVNDIGRATAIGYQHFPLKRNTRDQEIPFGDALSAGSYQVNVDVVAEEPISNRVLRARLVTEKESIAQGP